MPAGEGKRVPCRRLTMLNQKTASPVTAGTLVCRLRHRQLARDIAPRLERSSSRIPCRRSWKSKPIDVRSSTSISWSRMQRGPCCRRGTTGIFSLRARIDTLRLPPGAKYRHLVSLLETLPRAKQVSGIYTVQAVYEYHGLTAVSQPLDVELRAERI